MRPTTFQAQRGRVLFMALGVLAAAAQAAAPSELLQNGDFALTHAATGTGGLAILPDSWNGLVGTTENAGVWDGVLRISTAGTHNANHKYFVSQSFDAGAGGDFILRFDYRFLRPWTGTAINGAKVTIDNWYGTVNTPAPTPLFSSTYRNAGVDEGWHLGTSLAVQLGAGLHTLYVGSIGASQQNDQAAVDFDNISLTADVPEPASAALLACGGLALLGWRRRGRIHQ
jgi:hypothetical protein